MNKTILLIEDDLKMQEMIKLYLEGFSYKVIAFDNPLNSLSYLKSGNKIDVVILDLMLPNMDGLDVCKEIREFSLVPIIISSARADIGNKIFAYEIGADDYLAKPYEPRELVLKIESIYRRYKKDENKNIFELSNFRVDLDSHCVYMEDYEIEFTKIEYEIFLHLAKNRDTIVSREQLIHATSLDINTKNRTIDMHISNLRQKIGDDAKMPTFIKAVWGIGYKFIG